jgi:hypothetical protein
MKSNKILALLFFGVLMGALDISIVGPAIPSISETIRVDGFIAMVTGLFQSAFVFIPNLAVLSFGVKSSTARLKENRKNK